MFRNLRHVCLSVCILTAMATSALAETRSPTFGREWVKSHPFTLMALNQRGEAVSENNLYSQAGLNTMLAWKDRPLTFQAAARQKIPWQYHLDMRKGPLSNELRSYINGLFKSYPGGEGILLWDEPKLNEMADLGKIAAWLREAHPNLLIYTNLNPIPPSGDHRFAPGRAGLREEGNESYPYSYHDSIMDCLKIVQPDVLMTDIYPFWSPDTLDPQKYLQNKYYLNLNLIRRAALDAKIPYWMFVQAYEDVGRCRLPSESDLRMQVYSTLAFGFTGIAYYTYDTVEEGSMLDANNRPTDIYQRVASVNKEIKHLGNALTQLASVDVRYIPGSQQIDGDVVANPVPISMEVLRPHSWSSTTISNIEIGQHGWDKSALVGFFEDDAGELYFMVVNLSHGKDVTAEQARTSIRVTMAPWVRELTMLSRENGKPIKVQMADNQFTLDLPGGTGELFKLGSGPFPQGGVR